MSDQLNHNILEQDIERLSRQIKENKNNPEFKEISERELVKRSLGPIVRKQILGQPIDFSPAKPFQTTILPDYLIDAPDEIKIKVEKLIDMTFHQGIEKTVEEAQKFGPFILDAYHDALTDKLHAELKERKLI